MKMVFGANGVVCKHSSKDGMLTRRAISRRADKFAGYLDRIDLDIL